MNWSAHAKTSYSVYISTAVVMQSKFSAGEGLKAEVRVGPTYTGQWPFLGTTNDWIGNAPGRVSGVFRL